MLGTSRHIKGGNAMRRGKEAMLSISVATLLVSLLLLSSCKIDPSSITGITPTPITPSPTPRVCPPVENLENGDNLRIHPKLIVILFDSKSTNGKKVLEYTDGSKTADILEFLAHLLPKILGPGDQVAFFSLGFRGYEAARLSRYVSRISEAPRIVPTPRYPETLTPIPSPTKSSVVLDEYRAEVEYQTAVANQYATATQIVFEYQCAVVDYQTRYQATATQWSATKAAEATAISAQIQALQIATPKPIETPFAANNVYEGLAHATVVFSNLCNSYERCVLLIFDDLTDWRNIPSQNNIPSYLQINLSKVEIFSILPQCEDIFEPACKQIQDLWTEELESVGATRVEYYTGARLEQNLISQLGGAK
jgi:hypothetical protein